MSSTGSYSSGGMPKNPTFSTLKISAGGTFDLYNTADKTTNYERLRVVWTSNISKIGTMFGGSAAARSLRLEATAAVGGSSASYLQINPNAANTYFDFVSGTNSADATPIFSISGTIGGSSGTPIGANVAPTINQSGTAGYTAFDINPTETATGSGTRLLQRWAVGGTAQGVVNNGGTFSVNGLAVSSTGFLGFLSSTSIGGAGFDVTLTRDVADTLALRRGPNAQTFRAYNTYTDGSNYERFQIVAGASNTDLVTFQAGTGSPRPLRMYTTGASDLQFGTAGLMRWTVSISGHLSAFADNSYDIGASGANRPRNIYVGSGIVAGGVISTTNYISSLYSIITDGATAPGATVGVAKIYVDSADGDLKIIFGDGTIKTIVTDT